MWFPFSFDTYIICDFWVFVKNYFLKGKKFRMSTF